MESVISFLTGYHVVLFAALLLFAPLHEFRRFGLPALMILGLCYLAVPECYNRITGGYFWIAPFFDVARWYTLSFLLYWMLAMAVFYTSLRCTLREVLFYGAAAYTVQWLFVNTQTILRFVLFAGQRSLLTRLFSALSLLLFLCVFYCFLIRRLKNSEVNIRSHRLVAFLVLALFSINVFTQAWQHSYIGNDEFDNVEIYGTVFSVVIALLLLVVQFGLFEQGRLEAENTVISEMLRSSRKQYALSKENIDTINRKCHDMRHQINALRTISDEKQRQALFKETEDAIRIYSDMAKTGNEALDVVLTEKSLLCEEREIDFTYILSGQDFSFMEDTDIYSLFGNALDNAIESVSDCEDKDKRIITVQETRKAGFINLTFENYCDTPLSFQDGLPLTTKGDADYHGFGTKSIRFVAEKYGGGVKMEQIGSHFVVRLYFSK